MTHASSDPYLGLVAGHHPSSSQDAFDETGGTLLLPAAGQVLSPVPRTGLICLISSRPASSIRVSLRRAKTLCRPIDIRLKIRGNGRQCGQRIGDERDLHRQITDITRDRHAGCLLPVASAVDTERVEALPGLAPHIILIRRQGAADVRFAPVSSPAFDHSQIHSPPRHRMDEASVIPALVCKNGFLPLNIGAKR